MHGGNPRIEFSLALVDVILSLVALSLSCRIAPCGKSYRLDSRKCPKTILNSVHCSKSRFSILPHLMNYSAPSHSEHCYEWLGALLWITVHRVTRSTVMNDSVHCYEIKLGALLWIKAQSTASKRGRICVIHSGIKSKIVTRNLEYWLFISDF
jgi:hypothetical protein